MRRWFWQKKHPAVTMEPRDFRLWILNNLFALYGVKSSPDNGPMGAVIYKVHMMLGAVLQDMGMKVSFFVTSIRTSFAGTMVDFCITCRNDIISQDSTEDILIWAKQAIEKRMARPESEINL